MARLLSWPVGLKRLSFEPLTGPRSESSASNESLTGFVQTVASAFGAWRWQITFPPMNGSLFRRYRGLVTGLNGAANAVRVPFDDPDVMSFAEAGVTASAEQLRSGSTWSNGHSWSNGKNWRLSRPTVAIAAAAVKGATIIQLENTFWGYGLVGGEWLGFFPFHFGLYVVTEVLGGGQYRVWPPLRKDFTLGTTRASLRAVMAMRLESDSGATAARGKVAADNATATLTEVLDEDVRDYFGN